MRALIDRIGLAIFLSLAVGSAVVLITTIAEAGCTACR
jgi:hypothetical protein